MTTHPDTPADPKDRKTADDLVARLNARADHYLLRAEIMAEYADTVDRSDPYAKIADADADADHVLAATMREAAARIRSLEAQRDAAEARAKDYRTVAINQDWNWAMCNAYGREAYLAHRGEHVDACALNAAETRARENLDRMKEEG